MKKTFSLKFLVLSALLMVGNVFAFAQDPTIDQAVGTTLEGNVVTYRVNNATPITVSGEKAYSVTITGLDADGLAALGSDITLNVPVTFREKLGEKYYRFYVTSIKEGKLGESFYGYTEIKELNFVPAPGKTNEADALVPFSEATNKYTVGNKAFYGCSNMTKLTFTSNCSSIGEYAFQNTAITSFTIPAKCATISKYAFYNCRSLLTVTVASGNTVLTTLGDYVFGNSAVNTIDLTNAKALTSLTGKPFIYALDPAQTNDVLKEITLPSSLTTIDATVFQNCTFLQKVNDLQATKVTEINDKSFLNCRNLTQLDLPNADIVNAPFVGCAKLATLTFPDGYNKEIGKTLTANTNLYGTTDIANAAYSKADQSALTTITFKGTMLGKIASKAFMGSLKLNTLTFTGALCGGATIDESAFQDVTTLTTVTFNGIKTLISGTTDGDVTIAASAFQNTGITALDFKTINLEGANNKAFMIKANAFSDCADLESITFGNMTVKNAGTIEIEGAAFTNNPKLAGVTFGSQNFTGNGSFKIWDDAFATGNEALKKVEFGEIINNKSGVSGTSVIGWDANIMSILTDGDTEALVFGDGEHLEEVTFANAQAGLAISAGAFASTGLKKVQFGTIKSALNAPGTGSGFVIGKKAFAGGADGETVEFGAISESGTGGLGFAIRTSAFAADGLKSVKFATIDATNVTIAEGAFQSKSLESVEFGAITASPNASSIVQISKNAFQGGETAAKNVKFATIKDYSGSTKHDLTFNALETAFAADMLTTVEIGDMEAKTVTVGKSAFEGKSLTYVKLGNIKAGWAVSTASFGEKAFYGGDTEKTVEIGTITNRDATNTLTATIGANAFAADGLKSVKVGDMTATSLTIGETAFAGKKLETVDLGKMTAATLAISGKSAFANQNEEDVMSENITIGELGAGLNITGTKVFQGPQADGSELSVTIKGLEATPTIPANTFVAAKKGKASFTFDCDVPTGMTAANIAEGAFVGSKENVVGDPKKNTTTVTITGNYGSKMATKNAFLNVDELVIAPAVVNGEEITFKEVKNGAFDTFSGERTVTLGQIATGVAVKFADSNPNGNLEKIRFEGSVLGTLGDNTHPFVSTKIRTIEFAYVEKAKVKVAAGAVVDGAFEKAATAAKAAGQKITVIYQEAQTHDEAVNIFNRNAFVAAGFDYSSATPDERAAADANVVTLYTTTWCKANVFEAADNDQADATGGVQKKYVWRLGYSESDVAPGQDIIAKVAKPEGYTYAYGKLFIPKGISGKYKIKSEYDEATDKNAVQVYYGQIDNSNSKIYMYQLPIINDFFWIDATDVDHAFVIRTNKDVTEIKAEPVEEDDADEAQAIEDNDDFYYFGTALAVQNQLRYNPAKVVNQELRSNKEFKDRAVWMMANPATYGFGFTKIDKTSDVNGVPRYMPAKSLYIVGKDGSDVISAARNLTIVFADEETNTTGIETVETAEQNSDAIYNLNGVRVNGAQKGIYIKNGKKYIVK